MGPPGPLPPSVPSRPPSKKHGGAARPVPLPPPARLNTGRSRAPPARGIAPHGARAGRAAWSGGASGQRQLSPLRSLRSSLRLCRSLLARALGWVWAAPRRPSREDLVRPRPISRPWPADGPAPPPPPTTSITLERGKGQRDTALKGWSSLSRGWPWLPGDGDHRAQRPRISSAGTPAVDLPWSCPGPGRDPLRRHRPPGPPGAPTWTRPAPETLAWDAFDPRKVCTEPPGSALERPPGPR
ncbi:hypothetical protein ES708_34632 [subsurface metagenome]